MIKLTENITAQRVFDIFEEISKIPRGSGNTKAIADYLVKFAKDRGLEYYRDESDNVVIKKAASAGYESRPTVILQGHTDMVLASSDGSTAKIENEGVTLLVDGDFIHADGTTLGADDGVAVAYALALLDSKDIPHPKIEAVFTSDEETGLIGAAALDCSVLEGKILINIDSDDEGIFTAGCAGGRRVDITLPVKRNSVSGDKFTIIIDGLKGGHSGVDINKRRTNASKRIAEYISSIDGVRLISLSGGIADNAIPSMAEADFVCDLSIDEIHLLTDKIKASISEEAEKENITVIKSGKAESAVTESDTEKILALIKELPSGIINMSEDVEGQVETSLNLGIMKLSEDFLDLSFSLRSSKNEKKQALSERIEGVAKSFGTTVKSHGNYPGWDYKKDSHLRDTICRVYLEKYGKEAKVITIHAGLECGLFSDKIPELDCISMGPDAYDIHTPDERLSISSTVRVFEFILDLLKNI